MEHNQSAKLNTHELFFLKHSLCVKSELWKSIGIMTAYGSEVILKTLI